MPSRVQRYLSADNLLMFREQETQKGLNSASTFDSVGTLDTYFLGEEFMGTSFPQHQEINESNLDDGEIESRNSAESEFSDSQQSFESLDAKSAHSSANSVIELFVPHKNTAQFFNRPVGSSIVDQEQEE